MKYPPYLFHCFKYTVLLKEEGVNSFVFIITAHKQTHIKSNLIIIPGIIIFISCDFVASKGSSLQNLFMIMYLGCFFLFRTCKKK